MFQWTARFPLIGVELARGRPVAALEQARALLDPAQQPLPPGLQELVAQAVAEEDEALLERTRLGRGRDRLRVSQRVKHGRQLTPSDRSSPLG